MKAHESHFFHLIVVVLLLLPLVAAIIFIVIVSPRIIIIEVLRPPLLLREVDRAEDAGTLLLDDNIIPNAKAVLIYFVVVVPKTKRESRASYGLEIVRHPDKMYIL